MADSTIPLGESPQKDITRAERDPEGRRYDVSDLTYQRKETLQKEYRQGTNHGWFRYA
jgi:hypothetical protein